MADGGHRKGVRWGVEPDEGGEVAVPSGQGNPKQGSLLGLQRQAGNAAVGVGVQRWTASADRLVEKEGSPKPSEEKSQQPRITWSGGQPPPVAVVNDATVKFRMATGKQPRPSVNDAEALSSKMSPGEETMAPFVPELHFVSGGVDMAPAAPDGTRRPPNVNVVWRRTTPALAGVVQNPTVKYTMFLPDGVPVRETVAIKMKQATSVSPKGGTKPPGTATTGSKEDEAEDPKDKWRR